MHAYCHFRMLTLPDIGLSNLQALCHYSSEQPWEVDIIVIPLLHTRKLRLKHISLPKITFSGRSQTGIQA